MSAMGPCFISPAAYPSAWMYEISLSFSAPSSATGNWAPRPRKRTSRAEAQRFATGSSAASWRIISLHPRRDTPQRLEVLARALRGERAAEAAELHRDEEQRGELGREGLGRGDPDLRACRG